MAKKQISLAQHINSVRDRELKEKLTNLRAVHREETRKRGIAHITEVTGLRDRLHKANGQVNELTYALNTMTERMDTLKEGYAVALDRKAQAEAEVERIREQNRKLAQIIQDQAASAAAFARLTQCFKAPS